MPRAQQAHVAAARVLAGMIVFSVVCLLIQAIRPRWGAAINDRFSQLSQPVTLLAGIARHATPDLSSHPAEPASSSSLQRDMDEGELLALTEEVRTLRQRNAELVGLRARDVIPARLGRLIPSEVITRDSLAYRAVQTIDRGSHGGASVGQFVTSAVYLDRGTEDGLGLKRNVFSVESLIGQIVWVGPYTSRVRLLNDPTSRLRVRIARIHPDQPKEPVGLSHDVYILEGVGSEGMLIRQVSYLQVNSRAIEVGDLVLAEPTPDLPQQAASLRRLGRITAIHHDSPPVTCTLKVAPLIDPGRLDHVYVFDPTPVE